jgi:glycosyltransferase involved in cell wall biosynthesis
MKIGVISTWNGTSWGGSEELWAAMVEEAFKERLEVAVSISHGVLIPSKYPALRNSVRVFRRRSPFRYRLEKVVSKLASPFKRIFDWHPDVICISQGWTYESLYFKDLLDGLYNSGIPYVVLCQCSPDDDAGKIREVAKAFFDRACQVIFVSRKNLKSVERQLAHTLTNAVCLQNPVNLADLTPLRWPLSQQVSVASVARLEPKAKGQDILLEVLSSSMWRSRDWRLRLYGGGRGRQYLESLARHYGIAKQVDFYGHMDDIRSIWGVNHLLVLPSRYEGTPLALVEAMLCGRPAVVTDVGGNAEWIEDGNTGFVAEAPTCRSFGAALDRAWGAQANWEEMGVRARQSAFDRFDRCPGKSLLNIVVEAARSRSNAVWNSNGYKTGVTAVDIAVR